MAITLVQKNATTNGSGSQSSVTCVFTGAQTAGNLIVVAITGNQNSDTATLSPVTDSKGNAYTVACARQYNAGGPVWNKAYYAANIAAAGAGTNTVTVALSVATFAVDVRIYEFTGLTAAPYDQTTGTTGTSAAENSGATPTTTSANELLFGTAGTTNTITGYEATWTGLQITSNGDADMYKVVSSTGAYTATFTDGAGANWACSIATFAGPSSGTLVLPPQLLIARQAVRRASTW